LISLGIPKLVRFAKTRHLIVADRTVLVFLYPNVRKTRRERHRRLGGPVPVRSKEITRILQTRRASPDYRPGCACASSLPGPTRTSHTRWRPAGGDLVSFAQALRIGVRDGQLTISLFPNQRVDSHSAVPTEGRWFSGI
jgi:hypothetical protein